MSADNWAICPKCKKLERDKSEKKKKKADKSYGKVPKEEYEKLVLLANETVKLDETLREDYQCGIKDNGEVFIYYSGNCQRCGFDYSFEHKEIINL
jgi:hypothetical protein